MHSNKKACLCSIGKVILSVMCKEGDLYGELGVGVCPVELKKHCYHVTQNKGMEISLY